jgi:wobble nucleotide-excising tRNase
MIVKIRRVHDFRAFNGWRWPTDLRPLQQVNLNLWHHGTGKSTLASLLQQAHLDVGWASGLQADVVDGGGTASRAVSSAADAIWKDIRVFNKSYVEANLRFDEEAGSAAVPLTGPHSSVHLL